MSSFAVRVTIKKIFWFKKSAHDSTVFKLVVRAMKGMIEVRKEKKNAQLCVIMVRVTT
jgi:hypothetical protein